MKKILVPVDGSAESQKAAKEAVDIAKKYGSEITFLTVVEVEGIISYPEMGLSFSIEYLESRELMIKGKMELDGRMLDAIVDTLNCAELKTEKKVILGTAHPQIVETAQRGKYDLIVMGHRGLNPFKSFFLGSVAKRVVEDANCSVYVVK